MSYMKTFITFTLLFASQQAFCMFFSPSGIKAYEERESYNKMRGDIPMQYAQAEHKKQGQSPVQKNMNTNKQSIAPYTILVPYQILVPYKIDMERRLTTK